MGVPELCTLSNYASAIEMAFAANLLLSAWAVVYNFLEDRQKILEEDADNLENNPYIQEELSIEEFRKTITFWSVIRRFFWWIGLCFCLASAIFLYILVWNVSPSTRICDNIYLWYPLLAAVYVGPTSMLVMTCAGMIGNERASSWSKKLKNKAHSNRANVQTAKQRLKAAQQRIRPKPGT